MPNLTKAQVEKLMEGATKGPWRIAYPDQIPHGEEIEIHAGSYESACSTWRRENAPFIAALPDIAQTALDALQRVEDLERAYQDVHREKEYWRDEAWDCEHCFHGEDGSGDCALCHGNEPPNQCAYCKANAE